MLSITSSPYGQDKHITLCGIAHENETMKVFQRTPKSEDHHTGNESNDEVVDQLLSTVKKEVKQIMEEAVTRKFIHEDSGSVTSLCRSVDACLKYKLKKQSIGLFGNSSSTEALLRKVAKNLTEAKSVVDTISQMHTNDEKLIGFSLKNLTSDSNKGIKSLNSGCCKFIWIKIALFDKVLATIVTYLVANSSKYYETSALLSDQSKGSLLAHLLEGPCALEYTRLKTTDHLYTDPHADELVLRHRIHTGANVSSQASLMPNRRPALCVQKSRCNTSSSSDESMRSAPLHAREYVESLHQNQKTILLYGKNNVRVLPKGGISQLPGYLSLHKSGDGLRLKWTPNELISKNSADDVLEKRDSLAAHSSHPVQFTRQLSEKQFNRHRLFWDCAINVDMDEIVYLHCHHEAACGGTLILVGVDGVQSPAFHFPYGGHLLAFLTCLESGLQPAANLDPPLWVHKDTGKIFPKLKRKSLAAPVRAENSVLPSADDIDYVFRIVKAYHPQALYDFLDTKNLGILSLENFRGIKLPWRSRPAELHKQSSSVDSNDSILSDNQPSDAIQVDKGRPPLQTRDSLQRLCDTMKQRIVSRAFYGWFAHYKHLKTIREHLLGLVYSGEAIHPQPPENEKSLNASFWLSLSEQDQICKQLDIYKRVYYGGVSHELRKEVWPYLLGHYKLGSSKSEKRAKDVHMLEEYEDTITQWRSVEAILQQRATELPNALNDLEEYDAAEQSNQKRLLDRTESLLSNEVFMESSETKTEFYNGPSNHVLTKYHTVDYSFREDFCSVPMSYSYAGFVNHHDEDSNPKTTSSLNDNSALHIDETLLQQVELNFHRIDKDVHRCDRNYWYFTENNLKKLRNIICTYVWKNLDVGYFQGMCDLVAPLLVIFDDESLTYSCFAQLMKRMTNNFTNERAMDNHLANMRSLIRVLDPELFELMPHNGDYTHFFFCYRWLLLDFKRELCYGDVFLVWESIWASRHVCSDNYVAFIALAMVEAYRDIILDNSMDFIDVVKFFNEMAGKHDAREILCIARELVFKLQSLIEKK